MHQFQENFHYKLIYIFKIEDAAHRGLLKIGDATIITNKILPPNCAELNDAACDRINLLWTMVFAIFSALTSCAMPSGFFLWCE